MAAEVFYIHLRLFLYMRNIILVFFILVFHRTVYAGGLGDSLLVMFYNVENFFGCRHDSTKDDKEFLPESIRRWHVGRFKKKAANISKVIVNSGNGIIPAVVGLAEVENSYVMDYLTRYSPLKQLGYRYVMTDSPDRRGIDVALIYQREQFKLISSGVKRFDTEKVGHRPTRDMLHCCGMLFSGDTLDFIVVHLPSRREGNASAEKARTLVLNGVREYSDSLRLLRKNPNIVIMGDFNTYPDDEKLNACFNNVNYSLLTSVFAGRTDIGTYKYQGIWQTLDHMSVNSGMLKDGARLKVGKISIVDDDYLLEPDLKYHGIKPFRTYNGMKYIGGFSDHLPLRLMIYY